MNSLQKIKWLILSGVTETIGETPVNRLEKQEKGKNVSGGIALVKKQSEDALSIRAKALADASTDIVNLYNNRDSFDGCALKKTAHTLNGFGCDHPDVLCVLEAPDTADEKEGHLASGPNGDLFRRMLKAIDLDLDKNAYVTTLTPWRPPGNRPLTDGECAVCLPFLIREIDLIQPKVLLLFGAGVAQALLGIPSLPKARGSWHEFHGIPTRVSVPPAMLIKLPAHRKQAWEDLQQVRDKLHSL